MELIKTALGVLFFSLLDAVTSFLLLIHGNQVERFTTEASSFTVNSSLLDLWALSIIRVAVCVGSSIGIVCNPTDGLHRLSKSKIAITLTTGTMVIFTVIKLLMHSELPDWYKDPWFWSLMVWTVLASLLFYGCWLSLVNVKTTSVRHVNSVNVNINEGDQECLVGSTTSSVSDSVEDEVKCTDESEEDGEKKNEGSRRTLLRLLSYSKPDLPYILMGFVGLLLSSSGNIFLPLYTGKVIDGIVVEKNRAKFTQAIVIMCLISVVSALAAGVRVGMFRYTMSRLNYRINNLLFQSILKQEIGFFDVTRTGNITSRLTSDTTTMSESLSLNMNIFLRSIIQVIGYVVMMFGLSWRLTVLALVAIPLLAAISDYYGDYCEKQTKEVQDSLAKANNIAEEAVSTIRTVRSFANEDGEAKEYANKLSVTYKLRIQLAWVYAGYIVSNQFLDLMFEVSTLFYGGHLVLNGVVSGGQLVSFILYSLELGGSLENMSSVYTGLMEAAGASVKVFEYMDRKPKITNDGQEMPSDLKGHIEFKNVTFGYPSRPDADVLKDVCFTVSPGEVVALVGPSGGGKSTCVSLLQHFYEPQSGSVMLDGIPVNHLQHKYLHSQVAMVRQEPVLYAKSINDNIKYGLSECSEERIQEAAEQANAHKFITELRDKYGTQTGEKGAQLSGGQKQRVAIARALVRNPKVLLLDEATSALDAESEHLVQQALYQGSRDRTILIIAHRLSTVEKADRIVVIDHGKVLEQGSHQQLIRDGGMYARLVQRQLLVVEDNDSTEEPIT
ncbi:ABC-type oligopeptide transporter ABCB9-like [Amphiura filiformis]|uniref:ABC-type oligopeptide transporter ABCB9-like n=1 Tax=Amphiura filiformis TaxID=82378 RepID=UPI003B223848